MPRYIGLMSGTSLDGIDGVLVDFPEERAMPQVLAHAHTPFPAALRSELLALNRSGHDEIHRSALASHALVRLAASVVGQLLRDVDVDARSVRAIGSHGQTVRHQPQCHGDLPGYTVQLDNGALLAELTGIDVVCDFRRRDVAAGGQGAPLAPGFHAAVFARPGFDVAILNLGGFANLTLLAAGGAVTGFDCGPANAWLDGWCERHTGAPFDDGGRWAASGQVNAELLARLRAHPFFALPPPKSTGRDDFDLAGLDATLQRMAVAPSPVDVQATLAALTADVVSADLLRHAPATTQLWVCGGGACNRHVMSLLAARLPGMAVDSTLALGLGPTQVEAAAFAWLAHAHFERRAGNRFEVTGAAGPRVLGALYPAR